MRLIDADACPALFDDEFKKTKRLIFDGEKHLDNLAEGFMEAHNVIRLMPTVDATPVVHAHVVVNWLGDCHCSNCGKSIDCTSNYCNWCGAILDEPEQSEA